MYPSVRNLRLSDNRVRHVVTEMISSFNQSAIGRKLVRPVALPTDDARKEEDGFVSLGFNHISDKIWFVDGVFDDTSYSCELMGRNYGEGLAESETSYITKCILEKCGENEIQYSQEIRPSDILQSLEHLGEHGFQGKLVLADIESHINLWKHRNLLLHGQLKVPKSFSGYAFDTEICFFRGLPKGTLIIADSDSLGELLIKQSVEETASISEIQESEKQKTIEEIPTLTLDTLDEKVRILAYETIRANITNQNAAVILSRKDDDTGQVKVI